MLGGKRRLGRLPGLLVAAGLCSLLATLSPVQAQNKPEEFRDFVARMRTAASSNAAGAVAEMHNFLANNTDLAPNQVSTLYMAMSSLQTMRLKDSAAAIMSLDEGLNRLGNLPEAYNLAGEKARLLVTGGRYGDAVATLEPIWPHILDNGSPALFVSTYLDALEGTKQEDKIIPTAVEAMTYGVGRDRETQRTLPILVDRLIRANRAQEALGWCKLGFIIYPYEQYPLQDLTNLMTRALAAAGRPNSEIRTWVDGLQTPGLASPLRAVKLPAYDTALLRRRLNTAAPDEKVQILLALGEQRAAFLQARRVMLDSPESQKAFMQVCRVAKALTLNFGPANDFLAAFSAGKPAGSMQALLRLVETPEAQRVNVKTP
jgi:hypothetical protein